jgi:hypothetical protein
MESNTNMNDQNNGNVIENPQPEAANIELDEARLERYMEGLKLEQNLIAGALAGLFASVVGAALWAVITLATKFQIGWMAVGVGFLVGYAIRFFGKGIDKVFGIVGAVFALLGCILGNILTIVGFVANEEGLGFFETLIRLDYSQLPSLMLQTGSPIDLLFYGIAIYEGYRFSFRKLTEEEIILNASK